MNQAHSLSDMAAMRVLVLVLLMAIVHSLENVVPLTKITRSAADHLELVQVLSRVHAVRSATLQITLTTAVRATALTNSCLQHLLLDLDGPAPILLHNHQNTQYVGAVKVSLLPLHCTATYPCVFWKVGTPGQALMSIFDTG